MHVSFNNIIVTKYTYGSSIYPVTLWAMGWLWWGVWSSTTEYHANSDKNVPGGGDGDGVLENWSN